MLKGRGLLAQERGIKAASEGRYTEALPLLHEAEASTPQASPSGKQSRAIVHNALGGVYKALGKFDEAASFFELARDALLDLSDGMVQEARRSDIEHPNDGLDHGDAALDQITAVRAEAAQVIANLGTVRAETGRPKEATSLYQGALRMLDDGQVPANDPRRADVLNNLADAHHSAAELDSAHEMYAYALAIREEAFGKDHAQVAESVNNLAVLFMDRRQYAEALPLLRRALRIAQKTVGKKHPHRATALNNLAGALVKLQRPAEARRYFALALRVNQASLGEAHPSTSLTAANLAACEAESKQG